MRFAQPDARTQWLLRPVTVGILASTTHGGKVSAGAGYGLDTGPRETVEGKHGFAVGFRRGRTGSA